MKLIGRLVMEFSSCNLPKPKIFYPQQLRSTDHMLQMFFLGAHFHQIKLGRCDAVMPTMFEHCWVCAQLHQAILRTPRKCLKTSARRQGPSRWPNALKTSRLGRWVYEHGGIQLGFLSTKTYQENPRNIKHSEVMAMVHEVHKFIILLGGLEHVYFFHSVGNVIFPTNPSLHHFSEG